MGGGMSYMLFIDEGGQDLQESPRANPSDNYDNLLEIT